MCGSGDVTESGGPTSLNENGQGVSIVTLMTLCLINLTVAAAVMLVVIAYRKGAVWRPTKWALFVVLMCGGLLGLMAFRMSVRRHPSVSTVAVASDTGARSLPDESPGVSVSVGTGVFDDGGNDGRSGVFQQSWGGTYRSELRIALWSGALVWFLVVVFVGLDGIVRRRLRAGLAAFSLVALVCTVVAASRMG